MQNSFIPQQYMYITL